MGSIAPSPVVVPAPDSDQSNSLHNVFVYGTLLSDDVLRVLLKRIPQSSSAVLHGYQRFSIRGRLYPAILPVADKRVTGKVLFDITKPELDILDRLEADEYERRVIEISLVDGSKKLPSLAYVWRNNVDPNLYGEWSFEEWKKLRNDEFVEMATRFVEELKLAEPKSSLAIYESFYHIEGGDSTLIT
ncbi:AIG2-like protein [Cucumis melo var. makuwa]|uniref:Putative gamma-glutamylcyclotransferase n=1 Tax=Cucumis melo var. makuwa TaxID=1194695 RepID=A0A5A7VA13_CUCMM|nr:AIG2-like protein [Cucumis melo var. makuwa]